MSPQSVHIGSYSLIVWLLLQWSEGWFSFTKCRIPSPHWARPLDAGEGVLLWEWGSPAGQGTRQTLNGEGCQERGGHLSRVPRKDPPTPLGRVEVFPAGRGIVTSRHPQKSLTVLEFISLLYSHPGKGMWPQWSLPTRKLFQHFAKTVCCKGLKHRLWATPLHSTHTPKPVDFSASLF